MANSVYGEATSESGAFFRFRVYKRVVISPVEVYMRKQKSVISVSKRTVKGLIDALYCCEKVKKTLFFSDEFIL